MHITFEYEMRDKEGHFFEYYIGDDDKIIKALGQIMSDDERIFPKHYNLTTDQKSSIIENIIDIMEFEKGASELIDAYYEDLKEYFKEEAYEWVGSDFKDGDLIYDDETNWG